MAMVSDIQQPVSVQDELTTIACELSDLNGALDSIIGRFGETPEMFAPGPGLMQVLSTGPAAPIRVTVLNRIQDIKNHVHSLRSKILRIEDIQQIVGVLK